MNSGPEARHESFPNPRNDLDRSPAEGLLDPQDWFNVSTFLNLTTREQQVCKSLFSGKTRPGVAAELEIKERTVRQHTENLHAKLHVGNRVEMVLRIIQIRDLLKKKKRPKLAAVFASIGHKQTGDQQTMPRQAIL